MDQEKNKKKKMTRQKVLRKYQKKLAKKTQFDRNTNHSKGKENTARHEYDINDNEGNTHNKVINWKKKIRRGEALLM